MAQIAFLANIKASKNTSIIEHLAGSGLGFYGSSFGVSVPIGSQQRTTYVTDSTGSNEGVQLHNTAMITTGSDTVEGEVSIDGGDAISLKNLPNYLCPLNIRFTHSTPVKVQNCKLKIYDRNDITKPASGVTTWVYEARHPSDLQNINSLNFRGRNDYSWVEFEPAAGTVSDMIFTNSPGMSGLNTDTGDTDLSLGYASKSGISHVSAVHDWYVALSSEPESIGSKTNYALYFTVEYL